MRQQQLAHVLFPIILTLSPLPSATMLPPPPRLCSVLSPLLQCSLLPLDYALSSPLCYNAPSSPSTMLCPLPSATMLPPPPRLIMLSPLPSATMLPPPPRLCSVLSPLLQCSLLPLDYAQSSPLCYNAPSSPSTMLCPLPSATMLPPLPRLCSVLSPLLQCSLLPLDYALSSPLGYNAPSSPSTYNAQSSPLCYNALCRPAWNTPPASVNDVLSSVRKGQLVLQNLRKMYAMMLENYILI